MKTPGERFSVDELLFHAFVQPAHRRRAENQEAFRTFVQVSAERLMFRYFCKIQFYVLHSAHLTTHMLWNRVRL